MGSTLTVEPSNRKKKSLPFELKKVLQKKYGGVVSEEIMDEKDLSYIKALIDCDVEGAKDLYEYIEKNGEVILNEEF